jgi:hypothetical protein
MRHIALGIFLKKESATFDSTFGPFLSVKFIPCRVALQQSSTPFNLTGKFINKLTDTVYWTLPITARKPISPLPLTGLFFQQINSIYE